MPGGMSGVGIGAGLIGSELQGWASALAKQAMYQAYQDEMARQAAYRRDAGYLFDFSLVPGGLKASDLRGQPDLTIGGLTSDAAKQDYAAGEAKRKGLYSLYGNVAASPKRIPLANMQREQAAADMSGSQRAALSSYGDIGFNYGIREQALRRALNQISNFAGGTATVYPYRMYEAQHSYDDLAKIGALISSIGNMGSMGMGMGGGAGGGVSPTQMTILQNAGYGQYN